MNDSMICVTIWQDEGFGMSPSEDMDFDIDFRAADLTDEQIQEMAETVRLKAVKFLTEARQEARS